MKLQLAFFALLLGLALPAGAATKTSVANGNWNAGATWSPSGVPAGGDTVIIATGTTVTVNTNVAIQDITVQTGAVLKGDGTLRTFTMGKGGGEDLTNNGTINFGGTTPVTMSFNKDMQWGGSGGVWNFSAINLATHKLRFTNGTSFTLNLDGAGDPIQSPGQFNIAGGCCVANANITVNYNGTAAQILSSSAGVDYGAIAINNSAGVSLVQNLNATNLLGDVSVQSGVLKDAGFSIVGQAGKAFSVSVGATFQITNSTGMVTGFSTKTFEPSSTADYRLNGNQPVSAETYGNLNLSVGGTKTPVGGTTTVAGNFTLASGVTYAGNTNNPTYNFAGNFSNSGTFTSGTGTYMFNGTGAQSLTGATTFTNLRMNNTGSGLTINNNVTVSTLFTLTSGVVSTGANTLITSANCPGSISRTSGHIAGNLQLKFNTGAQTCTFHVGDSATANYTPVAVTFTNVSVAGSLVGKTTAGDYSDAASPIDPLHSVNRNWTLTLPGAGALSLTGTYVTAFTYLAADNDANNTASLYAIAKGDSCSPGCTWTLPTVSGTPTTTSATATGMTTFSVFAIGRRKVSQFLVTVPASPVSTCNAQSITITAQDSSGNIATNYTGTINISTSTSDGDWSTSTGNGTLTNTGTAASGTTDDGLATYAFAPLDSGVVALSLANIKVDSNVTVTVVDNAVGSTSTTSSTMQFRGNLFTITNDSIQVAGRNQAMTVTRDRGSACSATLTEYAGSKSLKAWFTADADHPSGAAAPAITGASPAITTSVPGSNNLTRTFTNGVANFTLTTTDVGKYVINLRDDALGTVDGSSPTITTRPFALVLSGIKQGATNNPGGIATSGSKFIAAADSFQATVAAYLWNSAADTNVAGGDGVPDAGASLAQIIGAGAVPSYRWSTTLSAASPYTPAAGTLGTLSNGTQSGACPTGAPNCFTNGVATPTNLSYNEVGSFTLSGSATNFLNSGINLSAIVFDNSATPARSGVVGRFVPDHFTLLAGSSITPACAATGFSYMGQPNLGYSFTIEARNKSNVKTSNYRSADYATGSVSVLAENNNDGTDRSPRLSAPTGSWSTGTYTFSTTTATFSRPGSPDGPFDLLRIGVKVTDGDGPVLASRDMDPTTNTDCTIAPTCTGIQIGGATTKARFGRLALGNAFGSELLDLPIPMETQYYNSSGVYVTNVDDNCTLIALGNLVLSSGTATVGGTFAAGKGNLKITKPLSKVSIDLCVDLDGAIPTDLLCAASTPANKTWLQWSWLGSTFDQDPKARATFGVYKNADEIIYLRENF
jgi:hypothetical protein